MAVEPAGTWPVGTAGGTPDGQLPRGVQIRERAAARSGSSAGACGGAGDAASPEPGAPGGGEPSEVAGAGVPAETPAARA